MYKFTAIIPVRAGSKRIKDKNISKFGKTNLLENKINILKKIKLIDNIVVSSDSNKMLEIAKKKGVKIHRRSAEYCDEQTKSFGSVVRHICESVDGENIIWSSVTSPLISNETYSKSIKIYKKNILSNNYHDSLMTVEPFKKYICNKDGPLNYKSGVKHVPSQKLNELYFVTGGIFIAPRKKMIKWNYHYGPNAYKMPLDKIESLDIDDGMDLELANFYYKKYIQK